MTKSVKSKSNQLPVRHPAKWRVIAVMAVLMSAAPLQINLHAQEGYYGSSPAGFEASSSWPWWHNLSFGSEGYPRFGRGFGNMTRFHTFRLPVNPPVDGPSFGYHQPCWRQVPVLRRCVTCETLQSNREVPSWNGTSSLSPMQIPPAPEVKPDAEPGHSDPDAPTEAPLP